MTAPAPAAPRATLTLDEAKLVWRAANRAERWHHDTCRLYRLGRRCLDCVQYEADQNCAADAVTRARAMRRDG